MHVSMPDASFATAADHAACRVAIRQGSRSFFAASLLLPERVRAPAYGLYAFCRLSDDAIDLGTGCPDALARLSDRLARLYDGRPLAIAADRAMADVVRDHAIPRRLPEALLEGLGWDAQGRRFETFDDLLDYAARVAGTVGAMMTLMMGVRDAQTLARACELGLAMQLTNIARDVGEDARNGRLYLPLQWLREAGLDHSAFLADQQPGAALAAVVERLLAEADTLYCRALGGIAMLPPSCRPAILSAAWLYREIGMQVRASGGDSVSRRARVPGWRKCALVLRASAAAPFVLPGAFAAPPPQVQFLVDAARAAPPRATAPRGLFVPQFLRVLQTFERLERASTARQPNES